MIDEFVFEAAPERLDEGVIVAVGLATHGSEQSVLGQDLPVSRAGKLGSTIRVDDKASSGATLAKRHAQGADDESGIQDLTHGPADHPSGEDIQDRDEIQPAPAGEHAGGIGDPDLIGPSDGEVLHAVGSNRAAVAAVGGFAIPLHRFNQISGARRRHCGSEDRIETRSLHPRHPPWP